jgi:hypothetical protein
VLTPGRPWPCTTTCPRIGCARWLAPWFARPCARQLLRGLIGVTMFVLATLLVRHTPFGP